MLPLATSDFRGISTRLQTTSIVSVIVVDDEPVDRAWYISIVCALTVDNGLEALEAINRYIK